MAKKSTKNPFKKINKKFQNDIKNKKINIEDDKVEMGTEDGGNKIAKFDDFEEDFEEFDFEQTPDYEFLKNFHESLLKKSHPKKCTRKFLRYSQDFVNKGEISQKSLDNYIDNEDIDKKIVKEIKKKLKKPTKNDQPGGGYIEDSCSGGGGYTCSSC